MKFEDVFPLMREGKWGVDKRGVIWRMKNGSFHFHTPFNQWYAAHIDTDPLLGEWDIYSKHEYQWLYRRKGEKKWRLCEYTAPTEEDLRSTFSPPEKFEFRRIEG